MKFDPPRWAILKPDTYSPDLRKVLVREETEKHVRYVPEESTMLWPISKYEKWSKASDVQEWLDAPKPQTASEVYQDFVDSEIDNWEKECGCLLEELRAINNPSLLELRLMRAWSIVDCLLGRLRNHNPKQLQSVNEQDQTQDNANDLMGRALDHEPNQVPNKIKDQGNDSESN